MLCCSEVAREGLFPMPWELYAAKARFSDFRKDWDALNLVLFEGHPLFDGRFIAALLDCFGSGGELLCVHRSQGAVTGMLIAESRGVGRWSLFLPPQSQVAPVLIRDLKPLVELWRALPGTPWLLDLLSQDPLYSQLDSGNCGLPIELRRHMSRRCMSRSHGISILTGGRGLGNSHRTLAGTCGAAKSAA